MQTEISDITRSHGPWNQCLDDGMNETGNISVRNHKVKVKVKVK